MALPADIVIWRFAAPTLSEAAEVESAVSILSSEERARADRFHFELDRLRYLYFHQTVRTLLASVIKGAANPAELQFTFGPQGKPSLSNAPELHFNLSHSKSVGALAISRAGPVGLDVEIVDAEFPGLEIAEQYFQNEEILFLKSADSTAEQARRFFKLWTAKEAAMKACGLGMELSPLEIGVDYCIEPPRVSCPSLPADCQLHTISNVSATSKEIISLVHFQHHAQIQMVLGDTPLASPGLLL